MRSVNISSPTLSLLSMAVKAIRADNSAAISFLLLRAGGEAQRGRKVEGQDDGQLPLLDELLDIKPAQARRDVPVDEARIIAGLVFADLGKLHAPALECRMVFAGEDIARRLAGNDLDAF